MWALGSSFASPRTGYFSAAASPARTIGSEVVLKQYYFVLQDIFYRWQINGGYLFSFSEHN